MLAILIYSAMLALRTDSILVCIPSRGESEKLHTVTPRQPVDDSKGNDEAQLRGILRRLATPQLILAVLALTSYHVQIITRISSGYVVWYWSIAAAICEKEGGKDTGTKDRNISRLIVRYMVMYAIVQGGLYASFLPPA